METKSGKALHPIGIGTWAVDTSHVDALRYSILKEQNHIDTAETYGSGEAELAVGAVIKPYERQDLFIASKLWKTSVGEGLARPAVKAMLERIGTDYLDMLYIHAPWSDSAWQLAIPQIGELIDAGLVRYFGVSNFTVADMEETMAISKHPIAANQLHYSCLYKQDVTEELAAFCKKHGIAIVAYSPIERKEVMDNFVIKSIAQNHGATPGQVALAWLLAKGTLPIPKATNRKHILENVESISLELTPAEMEQLDRI